MLFNSPEFIFLFLPLTLAIFFLSVHSSAARITLVAASLFFYSWQNPANLPILLGSILLNYGISSVFLRTESKNRKFGLWIGIPANLFLLGYFKYANWLAASTNAWLDANLTVGELALPLGISFFTFQQIAYLVDAYHKKIVVGRFLDYIHFVTFFPYITAGPLLRYQQIVPQFFQPQTYQFQPQNLAIGITFFAVGLFKKMVIADSVAPYANQVFEIAATTPLTLTEAWLGALAFTLQLYFDFSGYSDMAIGIARLFGITLPLNFNSPYKAQSIIDFWRRWHITLSNFLRDYLYIPLGGNRREGRRYANLMITMLVGGLWHGAGWTFFIWGGLHGLYLSINHLWRRWRLSFHQAGSHPTPTFWSQKLGALLTFAAVVVSWVFFRSTNVMMATSILKSMAGFNGISWGELMPNLAVEIEVIEDISEPTDSNVLLIVAGLLIFVWLMPNTQQWIGQHRLVDADSLHSTSTANVEDSPLQPKLWQKLQWQPNDLWAIVSALLTVAGLLNLSKVSEFLYQEF
ncbi:MAG: MBOAT family protein [Cyanobacteria bacterium RM1_2_2]|nr:MBOAT family protein [Cyanobacteria bacterium RM1_2_2]